MFLAGVVKYAERTWVLKSANNPISSPRFSIMGEMFDFTDPSMYSWDKHHAASCNESNTRAKIRDPFDLYKTFRSLFLNQKVYIFIKNINK